MEIEEAVRRMGLADNHRDRHWNRAVKVTDNAVQRADPEWLTELLAALLRVPAPTYPMRHGFEVALRRLAYAPGNADRIRHVRTFAAEGRAWAPVRYELAEVAAWLATGQPVEHLLAVFDTAAATDEFAACLLQETALRYDASAAAGYAERLRATGHPLGMLPLRRTPTEHRHVLSHHPDPPSPNWRPPGDGAPPAPGPDGIDVTATELDWPDAGRALTAHHSWISDTGDTTEARLYLLDRPLDPADFGAALLRVLGPKSVGDSMTRTCGGTTAGVLRTLFHAAAGGSAYGPRMHGAYGRRASWQSLAALVGVPGDDIPTIEAAAGRCAWLLYTSDWHLAVDPSMDTGIAVLRPDHRTVAILGATDSD
ncbi:hypothetical protein I0C86_28495 [Plantactinospora sp. S1510]|uniref:Uncharacterized protein n=1 Tax=Plantactinospora alkalitolerans TaxID=2789879 RepID=A0ABS0H325_9ACTN|nr:DUF6183 family protein [Plantactinospora alkalitolerans]MBF9132868.1 hypothetical protein [Plantactinospora alkalitolerans]